MANNQAVCASFKAEVMAGQHALGSTVIRNTTAADTLKGALYLTSATINSSTTGYTAVGEVSGSNYNPGGVEVQNFTNPTTNGTTAYWTPSGNLVYSNVTLASQFDCVLIYNQTQNNKSVASYTFPAQTVNAGTLTLTMPTNDVNNALLRFA